MIDLSQIAPDQPVLIAGPTASGKSALALKIAREQGGMIVNADALQVFSNWRVLTARPSQAEEALAPHHLYGHVAGGARYSVGEWLRDVQALVAVENLRPIIVGGTGLYFRALLEGLAEIPAIAPEWRLHSEALLATGGIAALLADLDAQTRARLDTQNPKRVQRAWEVQKHTNRGLADWQDATPAPFMPLNTCFPVVLDTKKPWLLDRINRRFEMMVSSGALEEVRANLPGWDPSLPSAKAIGAPELIAYLQGNMGLDAAIDAAKIATHQYAKRQRTWFRARMKNWQHFDPA